jgi:hypothetical protein
LIHLDADEFWYGLKCLHDGRLHKKKAMCVRQEFMHVPSPGMEFGDFTRAQMPNYYRVGKPLGKVIHRATLRFR